MSVLTVTELPMDGRHAELWRFVQSAYALTDVPDVLAVLAAGPLEDLLAGAGAAHIDDVEDLARRDVRFNHLLGGVWKSSIDPEVWQRVCRVRKTTW